MRSASIPVYEGGVRKHGQLVVETGQIVVGLCGRLWDPVEILQQLRHIDGVPTVVLV